MKLNLNDRSGNVVVGIMVAVVVTALVAGGLTYSWQKKQGDNKVTEVFKQAEEAKTKASELEQKLNEEQKKLEELVKVDENAPQEWVNYHSTNYNISFFYPKGWKIKDNVIEEQGVHSGIGLAPNDKEDFEWVIDVHESSDITTDKIISDVSNLFQFSDRQVTKEKIIIDGITSTKVVITTPSNTDWSAETIVIPNNSRIYSVINGALRDDRFSTFYNSISFK